MQRTDVETGKKPVELRKLSNKTKAKLRQATKKVVVIAETKVTKHIKNLTNKVWVNQDIKNRLNINFKARLSPAIDTSLDLSRKIKKAAKKARIETIAVPQKVSKLVRLRPIKLISKETLAKIEISKNLEELAKLSKAANIKKDKSKGNSLVCITNNTDFKRLPKPEALPYVQDAGWKYCSKEQYKTWLKIQASKVEYLKPKVLTKEEQKTAKDFVNYGARKYRRLFKKKEKQPTFSKETKAELEEIASKKERLSFRRGRLGEPTFVKKIKKEITQLVQIPDKVIKVCQAINVLPKGIKAWTKYKHRCNKNKEVSDTKK